MKFLKKFIFVIPIVLGMLTIGCGSDDDSDPQDDGPSGSFTANVAEAGDSSYEASASRGVLTKGSTSGPIQYSLYIEGFEDSNNRMMNFFVYSATLPVPGSFTFEIDKPNQAYYIENFDTSTAKAWLVPDYTNSDPNFIHGTVILSEISDDHAKGTFNFTAREDGGDTKRTVTNGTFDVDLTRQGF